MSSHHHVTWSRWIPSEPAGQRGCLWRNEDQRSDPSPRKKHCEWKKQKWKNVQQKCKTYNMFLIFLWLDVHMASYGYEGVPKSKQLCFWVWSPCVSKMGSRDLPRQTPKLPKTPHETPGDARFLPAHYFENLVLGQSLKSRPWWQWCAKMAFINNSACT